MTIVQIHETQQFGHKIGKTKILYLAIPARKFTWRHFPVESEVNDVTSNLHCKGLRSLLFTM